MHSFAVAALAVAIFVTTVLVGYTQANAVVCARGVHRAGCVGPHWGCSHAPSRPGRHGAPVLLPVITSQRSAFHRTRNPRRNVRIRRDPRTKYLGFTSRQWPFLYVLVGNWIFALAFFLGFKFAWHWVPAEWNTPGDKIALVFQCAAFALLPGVVAICIVAAQRLNPDMWVGRMAKPNSALDINTRFILNTFEQFTAYLVAIAVVALYSPARRSPGIADPNRTVRARTDLVLGRIPQASLFARLRLWHHLLPDRCNLYLVCPAHSVRHSHTTVLDSMHARVSSLERPVCVVGEDAKPASLVMPLTATLRRQSSVASNTSLEQQPWPDIIIINPRFDISFWGLEH